LKTEKESIRIEYAGYQKSKNLQVEHFMIAEEAIYKLGKQDYRKRIMEGTGIQFNSITY